MLTREALDAQVLDRLDPSVRAEVGATLERALYRDASPEAWSRHPIDVRVTLPWFGGPVYLALVGGRERRSAERRRLERRRHPLISLGNVALFTAVGVVLILGAFALSLLAMGVLAP
jgi:hypothetical protein